ncbi:CPBP family intramembrane glutamic endopeptidase [Ruminococcus sp.]|uniref:CPBP family intramembrane glutamic endopeptidase n=1 Tax=Ruminococcus sp. TaxID=41978 RepID=UPI00258E99DA|nr:CPBP family intramembrane glutamic endopeptidase [Ruminococcus sp.]MCR5019826.1 CPBP family intramembrane metalloprotease [Ruminococcus sp.]
MEETMIQEKGSTPVTAGAVFRTAGIVIGSAASFLVSSLIGGIICQKSGISGYAAQFTTGLVSLAFYIVILILLKKKRVLTTKGNGFFGGLLTGLFMIYSSVVALASELFVSTEGKTAKIVTPSELHFGSEQVWCILALFVAAGICEELLFRGIIFNVLRDLFGRSTVKGTVTAVFVSGILFGLYHFLNLTAGIGLDAVLPQVVSTAGLGIFLCAVYARWGNIWITVFLHALMDICVVLPGSMKNNENIVESISSNMSDPRKYIGFFIYAALAIYLLRKDKRPQMFTYSVSDDQ